MRSLPRWRGLAAIALTCLLGGLLGCGPRVVVQPIASQEDEFSVSLRRTLADGKPVPRGFQHPATISDVRLAHILANLAFESPEGKREPVIRSVRVYPLAEALNQAAQQATRDDEIVAVSYATERSLGLFTTKLVTAFRLYFDAEYMYLEFYDIERALEPGEGKPGRGTDYQIPAELPESVASFKLLPGEAHVARGRRALQVEWRNPYFAQPVSLSVRGNRFKRRSVLMEAAPEAPPIDEEALDVEPVSPALRDAQLRALDQLDGLRRQGLIQEVEFQRRRRLILQGKLEEAGYDPGAP